MNSLISVLWQLEVKDCPIATTILKNQHQKPHHYFYSQKQKRVLRKKNPNILSLLQQYHNINEQKNEIKQTNNRRKSKLLRIIRNIKQESMCVELCEYVMAMSDVQRQQSQGQYAIVEGNMEICLCTYTVSRKQQKIVIQYLSCQQPSKTQLNYQEKQQLINEFIRQLNMSLLVGIVEKIEEIDKNKQMKIQKIHNREVDNKIVRIQLLLGINLYNNDGNSIKIIDAIKLILSKPYNHIPNIMYNPVNNSIFTLTKQHIRQSSSNSSANNLRQMWEQSQSNQKVDNHNNYINSNRNKIDKISSKVQKQILFKQCECCASIGEQFKQVSNEQFKCIRRNKNMPIRGFNQSYYQICIQCYHSL